MNAIKVSLVVPIYNEEKSLGKLVESINYQTFQPDEVVLVDGGSIDKTVEVFEKLCSRNSVYKLIKTQRAMPGKGRNIGIENARNQWIALTDAGIVLDKNWLAELVKAAEDNPAADMIYGNLSPIMGSFFEKLVTLSFMPPDSKSGIRGKSIASCLLKKKVWQAVGGFPDIRAAEDLIFMEKAKKQEINTAFAPKAFIHWQLSTNISALFRKFMLYSKCNVWAKREWQWHYGVVKQYLLVLPFVVLTFLHSWWWIAAVFGWLFARTIKRLLTHRYEFGYSVLFNPFIFFGLMFLILTIDTATFAGWIQAIYHRKPDAFTEIHV